MVQELETAVLEETGRECDLAMCSMAVIVTGLAAWYKY